MPYPCEKIDIGNSISQEYDGMKREMNMHTEILLNNQVRGSFSKNSEIISVSDNGMPQHISYQLRKKLTILAFKNEYGA